MDDGLWGYIFIVGSPGVHMSNVHTGAFSLITLWTLDVEKNSAWLVMDDYVWCFQLFDFNRMCSYEIVTWYRYPRLGHTPFLTWYWYPRLEHTPFLTWYWYPKLGHTPFLTWYWYSRLGHTPFLTWYWYPRLGHTAFLSASGRSLMFVYRPTGAYPSFHLNLGV